MNPLKLGEGYRTHAAAIGSMALGVYYITQGQFDIAAPFLVAGLGAFGLKMGQESITNLLVQIRHILGVPPDAPAPPAPTPVDPTSPTPLANSPNSVVVTAAPKTAPTSNTTKNVALVAVAAVAVGAAGSFGMYKKINVPTSPPTNPPIVAPVTPTPPVAPPIPVTPGPVLPESVKAPMVRKTDIVANLPSGVAYKWIVAKQPGMEFANAGLTGFFFAELPGIYLVSIAWVKSDGSIDSSDCFVTVPDPTGPEASKSDKPIKKATDPPPMKEPKEPKETTSNMPQPNTPVIPPPEKKSVNTGSGLWLVVVLQPGTEKSMIRLLADQQISDKILGKHRWRLVDKDGKDENKNYSQELSNYAALARDKPLPWMYIVSKGVTLWDGPLLINSPADVLKRITEAELMMM